MTTPANPVPRPGPPALPRRLVGRAGVPRSAAEGPPCPSTLSTVLGVATSTNTPKPPPLAFASALQALTVHEALTDNTVQNGDR